MRCAPTQPAKHPRHGPPRSCPPSLLRRPPSLHHCLSTCLSSQTANRPPQTSEIAPMTRQRTRPRLAPAAKPPWLDLALAGLGSGQYGQYPLYGRACGATMVALPFATCSRCRPWSAASCCCLFGADGTLQPSRPSGRPRKQTHVLTMTTWRACLAFPPPEQAADPQSDRSC